MSWLGSIVDNVRDNVAQAGNGAASALPRSWRGGGRRAFMWGAASMGGGMGLQYEYSRGKGMNSDEAVNNSVTGGMTYSQNRTAQGVRVQADEQAGIAAKLAQDQALAARKFRLQKMVTTRIRSASESPGTKNGTIVTGALGLPGTASGGGAGSTLLGL